jgi:hypothetical protein
VKNSNDFVGSFEKTSIFLISQNRIYFQNLESFPYERAYLFNFLTSPRLCEKGTKQKEKEKKRKKKKSIAPFHPFKN